MFDKSSVLFDKLLLENSFINLKNVIRFTEKNNFESLCGKNHEAVIGLYFKCLYLK